MVHEKLTVTKQPKRVFNKFVINTPTIKWQEVKPTWRKV